MAVGEADEKIRTNTRSIGFRFESRAGYREENMKCDIFLTFVLTYLLGRDIFIT